MNLGFLVGIALTIAGLAGYVAGVAVAYPARSFSLTAVMVGITVTLISRGREEPV